jgi:UDP-glucose:(heptosyl)LPS alpha-1,3-glucosyltransferase
MRIALVILHADPRRGGAERYTIDLAAALARRCERVSLISSSSAGDVPGVENIVLPAMGWTRAGRYTAWLDAVDYHLDRTRYDVVHAALPVRRCDVYHPHAGLALTAVREGHLKRAGVARWLSQIGNRWNARRQAFANVEQHLLLGPRPPIVISLSRLVQESIRAVYRLPEDRHACLFNAVDLARFDPDREAAAGRAWRRAHGLCETDVVALMIAHNFELKGLRQTIAATAAVRDPRFKFVAVGNADPAPWRAWAQQCGVDDRVVFAGPTETPAECYAGADLFVLPTKGDACSLVVLEALAMGLPVITTNRNGATDAMSDGVHGRVLSDPQDVGALSQALTDLCDDLRRAKTASACRRLRPSLSFEAHLDQLLAIYARGRHRLAA